MPTPRSRNVLVRESNPLAGLQTQPAYIVRLRFAQQTFVIAVGKEYADTATEARLTAEKWAKTAKFLGAKGILASLVQDRPLRLGNLLSSEVRPDTYENRKEWNAIGAGVSDLPSQTGTWYNG